MSRFRHEKKQSALDEQEELLGEIAQLLRKPNELIQATDFPADIAPAFAAGRPELLALAQPRAMDADEVGKLYKIIQVLAETNMALQRHATLLGDMVGNLETQFKGLSRGMLKTQAFANFNSADDAEEAEA